MKQDKLLEWHRRQPFRPFAIHVSDGRNFPVRHPEFLAPAPDASQAVYWHPDMRIEFIDGDQITSLEQLPASKPNGRKKRKH